MPVILNETFDSYNNGNLAGQGGWYLPANDVSPQVQELVKYGGTKGIEGLNPSPKVYCRADKDLTGGEIIIQWAKFYLKSFNPLESCPYIYLFKSIDNSVLFGYHSGYWQCFDGNGAGGGNYLSTGVPGQYDVWFEIKFKVDHINKKWDCYINDMNIPKLINLGFRNDSADILNKFRMYLTKNTYPASKYIDELWINIYDPDAIKPRAISNKFNSIEESGGFFQ